MKIKFFSIAIVLIFLVNFSIAQNSILNTAAKMVGLSKYDITQIYLYAKYILIDDNETETSYLTAEGTYHVYHFNENNIAKDITIKVVGSDHYLTMQYWIQLSDWQYEHSNGDSKIYSISKYPQLIGLFINESDASYFTISM